MHLGSEESKQREQADGKAMRQGWAWRIQGAERMSECGKQSEQSGEEKETVREETEAQISRAVEALGGLGFFCEEATEEM